ncbi:hypothetical protein BKA62DRAFT_697281 [Auriculariales sp. MPI-PUGE-AT-0066]|nr:hypothetical protein BKA62DRAFT_697281 [Auriculariales sp. MPI-PUGE-AT-0066]
MSLNFHSQVLDLGRRSSSPHRSVRWGDVSLIPESVSSTNTKPQQAAKPTDTKNPNRYAGAKEAAIIREQLKAYEEDAATARRRIDAAAQTVVEASRAVELARQALAEAEEARSAAHQGLVAATHSGTALQRNINSAKAWLHPIRKTPDDILQIIFEQYASDFWSSFSWTRLQIVLAPRLPLNASNVCRTWRRIARNTPLLWSHVVVCLRSEMDRFSTILRLQLHLSLSKLRPMSLFLYLDTNFHLCRGPHISEIFRTMKLIITRCSQIRVLADPSDMDHCEQTKRIFTCNAPNLESLQLETTDLSYLNTGERTCYKSGIFGAGDKLANLSVNRYITVHTTLLKGLRTISIVGDVQPLSDIRLCLRIAPNAEKLVLKVDHLADDRTPGPGQLTTTQAIVHPTLTTFNFEVATMSDAMAATGFRFPMLEDLTLEYSPMPSQREGADQPVAGIPFARRLRLLSALSTASLRRLRINHILIDGTFARTLLQLHALQTLVLSTAYLGASFFVALTDERTPSGLTCITFVDAVHWTCPYGALVRWDADPLFAFARSQRELRLAVARGDDGAANRTPIKLEFPPAVPVPMGVSMRELYKLQNDP